VGGLKDESRMYNASSVGGVEDGLRIWNVFGEERKEWRWVEYFLVVDMRTKVAQSFRDDRHHKLIAKERIRTVIFISIKLVTLHTDQLFLSDKTFEKLETINLH